MSTVSTGTGARTVWLRSTRAFRNRDYTIFFLAQLPLVVGTWVHSIAMGWLAWRLTQSPLLLGLIVLCDTGPLFLLSPIAGTLADRVNKRALRIVTMSLFFIITMVLAVLSIMDAITIEILFVIALLMGINQAFDSPARQTVLPELVPREDLANAIALNSTMFNIARLIGPAVGGVVAAWFGEGWAFMIKSVSYIPIIIVFVALRIGTGPIVPQKGFFEEMARGFAFIRSSKQASRILFLVGICSFFSVPYFSFLPMLTDVMLAEDASASGMLMSITGIGSVAAAVLLTTQGELDRLRFWPLWSAVLLGIAQFGLSFATSFQFAAMMALPIGFAILSQNLASNTLLQHLAPPDLRGRVMAYYSMMMMGTVPLGSIVTGPVTEWIGLPATTAIGALCCTIGALAVAFTGGVKPDHPDAAMVEPETQAPIGGNEP